MIKYISFAAVVVALASCSNIEKSEEATVSVETAIIDGRESGRLYVITDDPRDTTEADRHNKTVRIKYDTLPDKRLVQAYDSAVNSTRKAFWHHKSFSRKAPE